MLHRHHKIPKHAGGTNDPSNIVFLTVAEHAEEHRLLFEKYRRWQDEVAWKGLSGIINHQEAVRRACGHNKGKKHSPETLEKLSRPKTPEHAARAGAAKRGIAHSAQARRKMSETRRSRSYAPMKPEHREKLRARAKLSKSIETRMRMSAARRLYWERKRLSK